MADERRANGRRYGRRRRNRTDKGPAGPIEGQEERPQAAANVPTVECAFCGKPIFDLSSALADKETGDPVHFDCALARVAEHEALSPGEKVVYIGSGTFAVVEYKDRSETAFTVKRRLPFEEEGKKHEWRKALSSRVSSL